jgi:hypothetical protein
MPQDTQEHSLEGWTTLKIDPQQLDLSVQKDAPGKVYDDSTTKSLTKPSRCSPSDFTDDERQKSRVSIKTTSPYHKNSKSAIISERERQFESPLTFLRVKERSTSVHAREGDLEGNT